MHTVSRHLSVFSGNPKHVDREMVVAYASDLRSMLSEGDTAESKSFLRTFLRKIVVEKEQVTVHYNLPVPASQNETKITEVLPMVAPSGPNVTFAKPIDTFFELSINSAPSPFGEQSFEQR